MHRLRFRAGLDGAVLNDAGLNKASRLGANLIEANLPAAYLHGVSFN